ncbi:hypothetical protein GCM10010399_84010 [Dactylosporangium fulvum]|uniref:Alpha/beta fold hydrolase n=1 Tax=Dactylosporangium fulvum TaxID=53359 RepID=A0ABY5VS04_9ACTN|nr:alpha/beta fold hydrolase [Dactylosporangium fulvum]UWP80528.1 alpha/beta fold hydrolase [Dactylosporangium fulvum]
MSAPRWEPSERWVRGRRGDVTVVDSRRPVLVWEPGRPVPLYAFPEADVRTDLLRPAADPPAGEPHGAGATWYDLADGGEVAANAAWRFADPELAGHLAFAWFRAPVPAVEGWFEEDEEIFVHPRDPYKRVDAIPSSRHVVVSVDGVVVADSRDPVLVFETGLPIRYYLPPSDVRLELFEETASSTGCPYKGRARYWSLRAPGSAPPDVAWSYPDPLPAVAAIRDRIAFYNEAVDITVDGERLERPVTHFSAVADPPAGARRVAAGPDGGRVSALVWGDEPQYTFLHGAALNAHTWDDTVRALGRPALVLDLPGHGESDWRDDFDYAPGTIAPAVAAAVEELAGGRPQILVGQSLGGLTALAVAALRPDLVSTVVLVDVTPGIRAQDVRQVRSFLAGPLVFASRAQVARLAVEAGIAEPGPALDRGVWFNTRVREDGSVVFKHHFGSPPAGAAPVPVDHTGLWPALAAMTVPVLLVRATGGYLPDEMVAEFTARAPKAVVAELDARHNIQEHRPAERGSAPPATDLPTWCTSTCRPTRATASR